QKYGLLHYYKKIIDIYKASRNSESFKKRQAKKERESIELQKHITVFYNLRLLNQASVFLCFFCPCRNYSVQPTWLPIFYAIF
ncbi:hypothetical protein, partial [Staphylococcus epidermidis]|uniref:hypothetical protein n=1 Tax=Staphylococcus epidermidis TaxID=1282 RepID=UPI001EE712CF